MADYQPVVKIFRLVLGSIDVGQLLDGLRMREESWRNTAIYLRDDFFPGDAFVCEDCSDPDEAERIANHYAGIIRGIEKQIEQQGGW